MLLKNLDIEIKAHGVFIGANVIIKRGDKHYSVYNNYFLETKKVKGVHVEPAYPFINSVIQHYLSHCENIDKAWKVERAESAERRRDTGAMVMEHEIQL